MMKTKTGSCSTMPSQRSDSESRNGAIYDYFSFIYEVWKYEQYYQAENFEEEKV